MSANGSKTDRPVLVVTGMGMVTSLGVGKDDNWAKLVAGQSGIRKVDRFPVDGLKTHVAAAVTLPTGKPFLASVLDRELALCAAGEALTQAGLGQPGDFPGPMFLGLTPLEVEWPDRRDLAAHSGKNRGFSYNDLMHTARMPRYRDVYPRTHAGSFGNMLADKLGTRGSPIMVQTACASGASAIALGIDALRQREADAVLCMGVEASVTLESLIRFSLLSALSTQNDPPQAASKPFSKNRDGFVMGEGAGALVIETLDHARARGARILGVIDGYAEKTDTFHRTRSSPDGKPIIACMADAIADAGWTPDDIDYINAHGTATPENDKMEYIGIAAVFGERAGKVPVSSNKSMIGHTLSAAGAVEAIFTLLTIAHQRIPPTINYSVPDEAIPLDVVPNVARDAKVRRAISNSFGFGGQNATLVFSGEPG